MNLKPFSSEEISKAIDGTIITWGNNIKVSNFSGSLSNIIKDSLYFLYNTSRDEDELISKLVKAEASGIVIKENSHKFNLEKWNKAELGIIEVPTLDRAFMKMAGLYTTNTDIPIVQVIGSSGKTTTKEMLGSILKYNMSALIGQDNFNTPLGIAARISELRDFHKAAVFEAGMNRRGGLKLSTSIINPTIGIVTSIHRAHLYKLGGSIDEIIAAKAELLEYLAEDSYLIINGDDENCKKYPIEDYNGLILTFGFSDQCDIWATDIKTKDFKTSFTAHIRDIEIKCTINIVGKYNVANALAAILAGLLIGINPENIVKGLANFNPYPNRLQILKGIYDTTLINDNFNANPDSTKMLLDEVPNFRDGRPVILVMGDMENPKDENSEYARKVHFEIGEQIGKLNVEYLFAIGKWASEYVRGAINSGMIEDKIFYFHDVKEAKDKFLSSIIPGCIALFKTSMTYVDVTELMNALIKSENQESAISSEGAKIDLRNSRSKVLVIDIDGVLSEDNYNIPWDRKSVINGTQDSLKQLKQRDFKLVLHTSRLESHRKETIEWLKRNNIPFDDIIFEKPRGALYIDERGYRFNGWMQFFHDVEI